MLVECGISAFCIQGIWMWCSFSENGSRKDFPDQKFVRNSGLQKSPTTSTIEWYLSSIRREEKESEIQELCF